MLYEVKQICSLTFDWPIPFNDNILIKLNRWSMSCVSVILVNSLSLGHLKRHSTVKINDLCFSCNTYIRYNGEHFLNIWSVYKTYILFMSGKNISWVRCLLVY